MDEIILYTSETCHRCKIVKHMLNVHLVHYSEVSDRDYILSLGINEVPAIKVNNEIISAYSNVLSWLENSGYYSFEVNNDESN